MSGRAHAEIEASATRQGPRHVPSPGEVTDHDLGAGGAERFGPFIFAMDQGPNRQVALAQHLHNSATHSAYAAGSTGDQNRSVDRNLMTLLRVPGYGASIGCHGFFLAGMGISGVGLSMESCDRAI